jgi:uncharacterized protein (DUF342 family)
MSKLKDLFMEFEDENVSGVDDDSAIEVYADSVKQALEMASNELVLDVTDLDYEILEKGTKGLFGFGRQPYRVLIRPLNINAAHTDLEDLERKLSTEYSPSISMEQKKDGDASYKIRVTKTGIWLTVIPGKGRGQKLDINDVNSKIYSMRMTNADMGLVDKEVKKASGKPVKIGSWTPNADNDGSIRIEVSDDEMKCFIHFMPPRFAGRHLEADEILEAVKGRGVVAGVNEQRLKDYLENMDYSRPLLLAEGTYPRNGNDAYIEYKVKVDKSDIKFEEDESGRVDFRNLELLENVVSGQVLAVKIPAEQGVPGRSVANKVLTSSSGKDLKLLGGKGTILSEDGTELSAEMNGQVVFASGKISVEPVFVVKGDVSVGTGNIVFLGSVIVKGSVLDNFQVKAAGNIEVHGTVQKAELEAEGDIIVRMGISGKDEAKIESTGGTIYAKFVQNSYLFAEKDILVPEGIIHSKVDAGKRIISLGRRARLMGGVFRAGDEVNARFLGAEAETKTDFIVGVHPKVLQQIDEHNNAKARITEEMEKSKLDINTLTNMKKTMKLPEEKSKMLEDLTAQNEKLAGRINEIDSELSELNEYVSQLEHSGKVCAEKTAYAGVEIFIKDKNFSLKDPYDNIKFNLEGGEIRLSAYEPPTLDEKQQKFASKKRDRR